MYSEFEEKQYEQPLNNELAEKRKIFPSGQVLESVIGIDAALYSKNIDFWKLFFTWPPTPFMRRWSKGVHLNRALWDDLKDSLDSASFPKFRCNIFIQYKRPEYIFSPLGKEYRYWKQPYFRYGIIDHQQGCLYKLDQRTSGNAIVAYACAAFHSLSDLWQFVKDRKLVENSNFVQPQKINGHKRYTFTNRDILGFAFSKELAKIEKMDLLREIDTMLQQTPAFKSNSEFISSLSRLITGVVKELPNDFQKLHRSIVEFRVPDHELARSIATISAFTFLTNISWAIVYE